MCGHVQQLGEGSLDLTLHHISVDTHDYYLRSGMCVPTRNGYWKERMQVKDKA